MDAWAVAAIAASMAALLAILVVVAKRTRRRGTAGPAIGAAMAAYDGAMHSTAHSAFVEMREQDDRTAPNEAPGDR